MNLDKAKEVLSAYRADQYDDSDSLMNEALSLLESNDELREWFEAQLAMDAQIFDAFSQAPPIANESKEVLLEEYQNYQDSQASRFRPLLAMAAVFVFVLLGLGLGHYGHYKYKLQRLDSFRSAMSYFASSPYVSLDFKSESLTELQKWLSQEDLPQWDLASVPSRLLEQKPLGCAEIEWRGLRVSLTCFHDSRGEVIHLFSIKNDSSVSDLSGAIEELLRTHDLQSFGWQSGDHTFLVMGSEPDVAVAEYLLSEA